MICRLSLRRAEEIQQIRVQFIPPVLSLCRAGAIHGRTCRRTTRRLIRHLKYLSVAQKHALHLLPRKRPGSASSKYRELVSAFIDGAVAVDPLGDGERRAAGAVVGYEFGNRPRAESSEVWRGHWREELDDAHAVMTVGGEGEEAGADHAELQVVQVVDGAVGVEDLVEMRLLGALDIDDGEALLASGYVGVGTGDVEVVGVLQRDDGVFDRLGLGEVGYVENLKTVGIDHEGIAELDGDAARTFEEGHADFGSDFGG